MSLKTSLLFAIKNDGEIGLEDIEKISEGYKLSNAERRLRELTAEGLIEPKFARSLDGTKFINGYKAI